MRPLIVLNHHAKSHRAHRSANVCFEFLKFGLEMPFLHILLSIIKYVVFLNTEWPRKVSYEVRSVCAGAFPFLNNSASSLNTFLSIFVWWLHRSTCFVFGQGFITHLQQIRKLGSHYFRPLRIIKQVNKTPTSHRHRTCCQACYDTIALFSAIFS